MVSDRIQRRIDRLLDQAEEAADQQEWAVSAQRAREALAYDERNQDAHAILATAETMSGDPPASAAGFRSASLAPTTPTAPPHPERFAGDRYEVRRHLGDGGTKRVFLVRDTRLDREVALALVRTEGLDATGRERVAREAQSMGRLGAHPNLVTVHDVGEEAGQPYITEEYMAGGSVADVMAAEEEGATLPLARSLAIAQDVCAALEFIHGGSLVHRDLKPSNVFLAEDGTAKLGDFGLAVALDRTRLTQDGSMVGTASYMPPEQALGGEVTAQSDLYALGAMLYELVTGRPPFVGDDPTSVISQHINTPPVAPSWHSEHCPPELEELILRLLQKAPQDRPASAAEVGEALSRVDPEAKSASHSDSGANPLDRLARGVFVGREAELERLRSAFDRAHSGQGGVAMLVGEPGSGKTRTSQELETYAQMRGAQVFVGRTHESEGMPSYWPWIEIGNAWAAADGDFPGLQLDPGAGSELLRIFPGLRQLAPNVAEPEDVSDPESAQFRLFDAYTSFIRAVSADQPLLLVLDDLHWADKPSLMLLQHLSRSLSRMRVLVVGTYRDTDLVRTHPLSEALVALNREGALDRLLLRGLSESEVGAYIRATANVQPPRELVERIHRETEGNPFFLSEVVALMTQEGAFAAGAQVALPQGVREALGRRLDRLSEETNELLHVAAVAGREFRHDTLAALGDHGEDELFALLEEGLSARVIEETGSAGQYRFTHALMQETLLDELSTTRRVRMHGRIGEALEQRWGQSRSDDRATRLAQHFVEAATLTDRHAEKALHYSQLAAEQAEGQAGWGEAARRYDDCLALIADTDTELEADEAELLVAAGRCHRNANAQRDAWRRLLRAIDLYRNRQDAIGMAGATLEALQVEAPPIRLTALAEEALDDLGDTNPEVEARLLGRLLTVADRGSPADEERRRERATELAERHNLADVRAMLEVRAASDAFEAGRFNEAAAAQLEAQRQFEALGLARDAAGAYAGRVINLTVAGRLAEARLAADDSVAYARRHHLPYFEEYTAGSLGGLLLGLCDFDALATVLDEQAGAASYRVNLIAVNWALQRGDLAAAREALPAVEVAGGIPTQVAIIHALHARALHFSGDRDAASEHFASMREGMQATNLGREIGGIRIYLPILTVAAEAGPTLGEAAFLGAALEAFRTVGPPFVGPWGTSARELYGRYALALDEVSEAEEQFVATLEWAEREGAPVIAGRCHQDLAEVAVRRSETAEAMRHLDAAAELFQQYGARLYLDQVIAKKLELQGASGDVSSTIDALTRTLQEERPDLASRVAPDGTVTILFSDIEGSTALNVELGDDRWMELLAEHNRLVRTAIAEHRGYEVKTEGDAFMVAFQSARDALRCAIDVQRAFEARNAALDDGEHALRVRVGLHTGEPVREGADEAADFYGTHVVMAARIAARATGGEVLISALLHELVASSGEFTLEAREPAALKGLKGEHRTYAVAWG